MKKVMVTIKKAGKEMIFGIMVLYALMGIAAVVGMFLGNEVYLKTMEVVPLLVVAGLMGKAMQSNKVTSKV